MLAFLANAALYVVPFLVVITVIVTVHELGHFLTARAFGVAVDRFSIGFGRAIVSWRGPLRASSGGSPGCRSAATCGSPATTTPPAFRTRTISTALRAAIRLREGVGAEKRYFSFKPLWQRALIVLAGPAANFVCRSRSSPSCSGRSASRSPRRRCWT